MNKPEDHEIKLCLRLEFLELASDRFLGCRACRRYDTGREGRDVGEVSDRAGDKFATS